MAKELEIRPREKRAGSEAEAHMTAELLNLLENLAIRLEKSNCNHSRICHPQQIHEEGRQAQMLNRCSSQTSIECSGLVQSAGRDNTLSLCRGITQPDRGNPGEDRGLVNGRWRMACS